MTESYNPPVLSTRKHCAHCRAPGNPHVVPKEVSPTGQEAFLVNCWECGASTGAFASQAEADAAWNRRDGGKADA